MVEPQECVRTNQGRARFKRKCAKLPLPVAQTVQGISDKIEAHNKKSTKNCMKPEETAGPVDPESEAEASSEESEDEDVKRERALELDDGQAVVTAGVRAKREKSKKQRERKQSKVTAEMKVQRRKGTSDVRLDLQEIANGTQMNEAIAHAERTEEDLRKQGLDTEADDLDLRIKDAKICRKISPNINGSYHVQQLTDITKWTETAQKLDNIPNLTFTEQTKELACKQFAKIYHIARDWRKIMLYLQDPVTPRASAKFRFEQPVLVDAGLPGDKIVTMRDRAFNNMMANLINSGTDGCEQFKGSGCEKVITEAGYVGRFRHEKMQDSINIVKVLVSGIRAPTSPEEKESWSKVFGVA